MPRLKLKINLNDRFIYPMSHRCRDTLSMAFRLQDARRAAEFIRRYWAIAAMAALVIASIAGLAAVASVDLRRAEAYRSQQTLAVSVEKAAIFLGRQQHDLERLATVATKSSDEAAQLLLDQLPSLTPGTHAAALYDPTGMLMLRSAGVLEDSILASLGNEAAKKAAAQPDAAMLVTHAVRDADSDATLIGLARPWLDADGQLGGIALVALDRMAFAQLDLVRDDGTPLFADSEPDKAGARNVSLNNFPLMLRYRAAPTALQTLRPAWPFVAIALIGIGAAVSLLALLIGRLHAAEDANARQASIERGLRAELAITAAVVDRSRELNRTKSQFFAQVTHELRTPLNAIIGFSETIRHEMFGPVANARYLEYAGLIHDAGAHLLSLINDLLDNARIEAGKMEIVPIRVSASALARSALDLVELLAEDRGIAMNTSGLTTCPDLNVDPRAMKQVLVNLLSNAIKYTPRGGRIDVSFAALAEGGMAIEIADTGIGMSTEDLQVAFEPFGRASAIEARRQQGTGLGLSLARALVHLHGGELTLKSRLDSGTTVRLILPASAACAAAGTAATQDAGTNSVRAA
jgi:signal transduction histidine kinase